MSDEQDQQRAMHEENKRVLDDLQKRVLNLEHNYAGLQTAVDANTDLTQEVKANTDILVEIAQGFAGFGRFCGAVARWTAKLVKWLGLYLAPLGLLLLGLVAMFKGNPPPPPPGH